MRIIVCGGRDFDEREAVWRALDAAHALSFPGGNGSGQNSVDGVIAFPGGNGTADMVRIARAAGVPVWEPYCQS